MERMIFNFNETETITYQYHCASWCSSGFKCDILLLDLSFICWIACSPLTKTCGHKSHIEFIDMYVEQEALSIFIKITVYHCTSY